MKNINLTLCLICIFAIFYSSSAQNQGASAVNQLTQNLQPLVCEAGKNCAISAYSILNALGSVYAGAQGETQSQVQTVLNLNGLNMQEVHQVFKSITDSVSSVSSEIELFQANRFYGEQTFPFLPEYLNTLQTFYNSDAINLDFLNDAEGSRDEINAWVEEVTKTLIQDLLPDGSITPATISVLVNALYFKGLWIEEFDVQNTQPRKFTTSAGSSLDVPTMAQFEKQYVVGDIPNVQSSFIKLPYQGDDVSMYIVVPKTLDGTSANQGINSVLQNITLSDIFNQGVQSTVNLFLPKFTIEFETALSAPLKQLGMVDAFDRANANFGGMVDLETIPQNVVISEGYHKAKVIVDETGTEAAAATALVAIAVSLGVTETTDFVVDEPFGFYIVKEPENVVLFSGSIDNPTSE
eukprot:TRINITY_DN5898_c0_g1_i8.p1 TRINITY_DN5898_c0_g1~~TRINITY_DN5898_c0_g1_i8.p1  ORF type:complete len:434 (-),score=64.88 TRINITY_DN5898_c0_g1_i8:602-1828(-)